MQPFYSRAAGSARRTARSRPRVCTAAGLSGIPALRANRRGLWVALSRLPAFGIKTEESRGAGRFLPGPGRARVLAGAFACGGARD